MTIALIGFAYFAVSVVALYFLNPSYDLIRSFEGNYRLAPYEFLIASTFFGLALGSLALVMGLHQGLSRSPGSWAGLLLLGVWSVGILIAGICPADDGGSTVPHLSTVLIAGIFPLETQAYPETIFSFIHILAILGSFFSLSFAALLLSWRFKDEEKWQSIHHLSSLIASIMVAASSLVFATLFLAIHTELAGFGLILLTLAGLSWLFLTAARLWLVVVGFVSK